MLLINPASFVNTQPALSIIRKGFLLSAMISFPSRLQKEANEHLGAHLQANPFNANVDGNSTTGKLRILYP